MIKQKIITILITIIGMIGIVGCSAKSSQLADNSIKYMPNEALPDVDISKDTRLIAQAGNRTIVQSEHDANADKFNNNLARVTINGLGTVEFDNGEKADDSLMSEVGNMKLSPNTILSEYENAYPTGTKWTNNYYYECQNKDIYRGGYGCAGFAYMLSDAIYKNAHTIMTDDVYQIVPYSVVELYGNQHTAFVLSVNKEAGEICVCEANVNGTIVWGSFYSFTDVSAVLLRQM